MSSSPNSYCSGKVKVSKNGLFLVYIIGIPDLMVHNAKIDH